jgi:hypothetical protein
MENKNEYMPFFVNNVGIFLVLSSMKSASKKYNEADEVAYVTNRLINEWAKILDVLCYFLAYAQ